MSYELNIVCIGVVNVYFWFIFMRSVQYFIGMSDKNTHASGAMISVENCVPFHVSTGIPLRGRLSIISYKYTSNLIFVIEIPIRRVSWLVIR